MIYYYKYFHLPLLLHLNLLCNLSPRHIADEDLWVETSIKLIEFYVADVLLIIYVCTVCLAAL